jgi:hypothetical protein
MNEFKGTPGPWVSRPILGENFRVVIKARSAPGGIALTLRGLGEIEEDANAHLIAAAPELLEALQDTLADAESMWVNVSGGEYGRKEYGFDEPASFSVARAAIARALGQQVNIGEE